MNCIVHVGVREGIQGRFTPEKSPENVTKYVPRLLKNFGARSEHATVITTFHHFCDHKNQPD